MNQLAGAPMSDHGSVLHSTFRIERSYPQHPAPGIPRVRRQGDGQALAR
jgi:hypothetical protein